MSFLDSYSYSVSCNCCYYGLPILLIGLFSLYLLSRCGLSLSFTGKHVVITGGSSGIGKSLASESLKMGSSVTLIARNLQTLNKVKAELEPLVKDGQKLLVVSLDVSNNLPQIELAFQKLVKDMGKKVDVLINCAGSSIPGTFDELDPSAFEQMMRVNYFGSVYPTRAVVPSMKEHREGSIVFVSSQAGQVGIYGFSAYTPSKFALVGLAQVLRMELETYNIKVSVAYPPDTDTPGFENENKCKPEETRLLSEAGGLFTSQEVALSIISGLRNGDFTIFTGLDGWMLGNVTAGMAPPNSWFHALYQILLTSVLRMIAIGYSFHFASIINGCRVKRDQNNNKKEK